LNRATARVSNTSVFPDSVSGLGFPGAVGTSAATDPTRVEVLNGYGVWKRAADVALGLGGLIAFSPFMLLAAALVKLTSPGPVFFSQDRVGVDRRSGDRRFGPNGYHGAERRQFDRRGRARFGKPFKMYKFRSMVDGAESNGPKWTAVDDPRVTRVGRILRKTRIDETPQFLNVLRGDMSFVGPRPERDNFYNEISKEIPEFSRRLRVKPGLTGLAQVNVGYCNNVSQMRSKLEHDLEYLRTVGPATDAKILVRTISVVVTGRGAF
jgi:lipopolysaccharide/colanic/teichoic acid biosynthesis glycosyltransferase